MTTCSPRARSYGGSTERTIAAPCTAHLAIRFERANTGCDGSIGRTPVTPCWWRASSYGGSLDRTLLTPSIPCCVDGVAVSGSFPAVPAPAPNRRTSLPDQGVRVVPNPRSGATSARTPARVAALWQSNLSRRTPISQSRIDANSLRHVDSLDNLFRHPHPIHAHPPASSSHRKYCYVRSNQFVLHESSHFFARMTSHTSLMSGRRSPRSVAR